MPQEVAAEPVVLGCFLNLRNPASSSIRMAAPGTFDHELYKQLEVESADGAVVSVDKGEYDIPSQTMVAVRDPQNIKIVSRLTA